jgi:hypothetical protein
LITVNFARCACEECTRAKRVIRVIRGPLIFTNLEFHRELKWLRVRVSMNMPGREVFVSVVAW